MRSLLIVGVVAMICASCSIGIETAHCQISTGEDIVAYRESRTPAPEPTPGGTPSPVRADFDYSEQQVLATTQTIPAGTTVRELIDAPTVYLTAEIAPQQLACDTTINTVAELFDLQGYAVSTDVEPGRFLDTRQFVPAG